MDRRESSCGSLANALEAVVSVDEASKQVRDTKSRSIHLTYVYLLMAHVAGAVNSTGCALGRDDATSACATCVTCACGSATGCGCVLVTDCVAESGCGSVGA